MWIALQQPISWTPPSTEISDHALYTSRLTGEAAPPELSTDIVTVLAQEGDDPSDTLIIIDEWQFLHDLLLEEAEAGTDTLELEMHGGRLHQVCRLKQSARL